VSIYNLNYGEFEKDRDHYVLWSGGLDSTFLLAQIAQKHGLETKPVNAVYINHFQLGRKPVKEIQARDEILPILTSRGLHIRDNFIKVSASDHIYHRQQKCGQPQLMMWASNLLPYVTKDAVIYIAAVRDDDVSDKTVELIKEFVDASNKFLGYAVDVVFPLRNLDKRYIFEWYEESHNREVYEKLWYCEKVASVPTFAVDVFTPCGHCRPCRIHIDALLGLAGFNVSSRGNKVNWYNEQLKKFNLSVEWRDDDEIKLKE